MKPTDFKNVIRGKSGGRSSQLQVCDDQFQNLQALIQDAYARDKGSSVRSTRRRRRCQWHPPLSV